MTSHLMLLGVSGFTQNSQIRIWIYKIPSDLFALYKGWKLCALTRFPRSLLYKGLSSLLNSAASVSNYIPTSGHRTALFFTTPILEMAFPGLNAVLQPEDTLSKAVRSQRKRKRQWLKVTLTSLSTYLIPHMIHMACFYFPKDISS